MDGRRAPQEVQEAAARQPSLRQQSANACGERTEPCSWTQNRARKAQFVVHGVSKLSSSFKALHGFAGGGHRALDHVDVLGVDIPGLDALGILHLPGPSS